MNYFELFGLKEAPAIDKSILTHKYFELQKKFHPDFYTNENEAAQENITLQSAEVNKAYNIFRNSDKTIEYYLQLRGIITSEEKYNLPPDFLMEMMELNESFDDKNFQATQNSITSFERKLEDGVQPLLFTETDSLNDDSLQRLKEYFYKKKYLKRILERLDD